MAGQFELLFSVNFSAVSTITVTHNLDRLQVGVIVRIGNVARNDLLTIITPLESDPRNAVVVVLDSPQSGEILICDTDYVFANIPSPEGAVIAAIASTDKTDTSDPTVNDDDTQGYLVGSRWINTTGPNEFICSDVTTGAAVWTSTIAPSLHAVSHENGGDDEISVAGLSGLLVDSQTPLSHAASHENGGGDEISVAGLSGLLTDSQTPLAHASTHLSTGSDSIAIFTGATGAVDGLDGLVKKPLAGEDGLFLRGDAIWAVPAGGGEANTASNVGTAGVGVFKQKTGVDLEFKKINAGSSKISITDDTGDDELDVDVVEANISHTQIANIGTNSHPVIDTHLASTVNPHGTDVGNLGSGTLAELNTAITDATLDDSSDSRTPTAHAASHENGGGDEISVAGLSGLLADSQTPLSHAASHENGGGDEISVAGLSGLLADSQTPLAHAATHLSTGSDSIAIFTGATGASDGLDGLVKKPLTGEEGLFLRGDATWAAASGIPESIVDAKGDLIVATADNTVVRLAVGSDNDILTAASGEATGIKWTTPNTAVFVDYYNSAAYAGITTTASTLPLNTTRQSDAAFTLAANEVTVNTAGTYRVDYDLSLDESSTSDATVDMWLEVNDVEVGGTRARMFHDNNMEEGGNHGMCILTLAATDVLRVRAQVVGGTNQTDTLANATRLLIHTVGADGATGPQGPAGSGSTIIVEDEGSVVGGGPHTNLDFVGAGVTVTDGGSGVATITIPRSAAIIAQYRMTTNLTITTSETTVVLDATDFEDSNYTRAGENITINTAGIYRIAYNVHFFTNANARRTIACWVENNTVAIVPSFSADYARNNIDEDGSAGASFMVQLAASDVVRLRAWSVGTAGDPEGIGNRMWICLEFLRAP